jgi:hypothetical protein
MQTSPFIIFDIELLELSTFISDFSLGIACLIYFILTKRNAGSITQRYISFFFLFMSLSAFVGGFSHLLYLYFGEPLKFTGWLMSCLSVYFIQSAISSDIIDDNKRIFYEVISRGLLVLFSFLAMIYMDFLWIKLHIATGLLLTVMPVLISRYLSSRITYYLTVSAGICLAIVPAILHSMPFNIGQWVNMNDFSHYFLILCLYFVFKGFRKLHQLEMGYRYNKSL